MTVNEKGLEAALEAVPTFKGQSSREGDRTISDKLKVGHGTPNPSAYVEAAIEAYLRAASKDAEPVAESDELPSNADVIETLERGMRYLSRTATVGSKEAEEFDAMGDSIVVNEGDFHNVNFFAPIAARRLRAALAHPAPSTGEGVKVKPIPWRPNGGGTSNDLYSGELAFNTYYTVDEEGPLWRVWRGQFLSEAGLSEVGAVADLEAAKAIAQADYEARIRSALE